MIKRNTELLKDTEMRLAVEFIQEQALGKAIVLSAGPSATVPLLEADEWGFYGGKLYFRIQNIIYAVTPSSTITVTV